MPVTDVAERLAPRRDLRAIGFNEHLTYFDTDHDRKISLRETQRGLERLGLGHLLTVPGAVVIHLGVAGLGLLRGNLQSPAALALPKAGFVRHPDTNLIDAKGDFDATRLDAVFAEYGRVYAGEALTLGELLAMTRDRVLAQSGRDKLDLLLLPTGLAAALLEWGALIWMAGELRDGKRVLSKRAVDRFYTDPQFFHDVAKHVATQREQRSRKALGRARNFAQSWVI